MDQAQIPPIESFFDFDVSRRSFGMGYTISLVGYCMDIFLFGILTIQTYLYYIAFPRDTKLQKSVVLSVYLIGMAQTLLALHDFYMRFCLKPTASPVIIVPASLASTGNLFIEDIVIGTYAWFTVYLSGGLVALIVQLVYASRIWKLTKSKIVTILVALLAFGQFVASVLAAEDLREHSVTFIYSHASMDIAGIIFTSKLRTLTWGPLGILCDTATAGYMTYYLSKQLRKSIHVSRRTSVIVNRIRRLALETGLLTALVSIGYTIALVTSRNYFMLPGLILGKIYSNSLLVMLNNRFTIIGGRHFEDDNCISLYNDENWAAVIPPTSTIEANL